MSDTPRVWIEKLDWNRWLFHRADGTTTELDYTEMLMVLAMVQHRRENPADDDT